MDIYGRYPLVNIQKAIENGPVEIVDLAINSMVIVHSFLYVYQAGYLRFIGSCMAPWFQWFLMVTEAWNPWNHGELFFGGRRCQVSEIGIYSLWDSIGFLWWSIGFAC